MNIMNIIIIITITIITIMMNTSESSRLMILMLLMMPLLIVVMLPPSTFVRIISNLKYEIKIEIAVNLYYAAPPLNLNDTHLFNWFSSMINLHLRCPLIRFRSHPPCPLMMMMIMMLMMMIMMIRIMMIMRIRRTVIMFQFHCSLSVFWYLWKRVNVRILLKESKDLVQ